MSMNITKPNTMKALIFATLLTVAAMATETTIWETEPDPRGNIYSAILIQDTPNDDDRIYLSIRFPDGSAGKLWTVWKSTDGGTTWTAVEHGAVPASLFHQTWEKVNGAQHAMYTLQSG